MFGNDKNLVLPEGYICITELYSILKKKNFSKRFVSGGIILEMFTRF